MPRIASAEQIAAKWSQVTPQRQADYQAGVENTAVDWSGPTAGAQGRWADGVASAAANGSFARGVTAAGTEKWRTMTVRKGIARWGAGVRESADEYRAGFAPFRDVIERTTLPPRYASGDPRNYARVQAMGDALHQRRVSGR